MYNKQFWMVYCPEKGPMHRQHESYQDAIDEAIRLANKEVEHDFYVLEAKDMFRKVEVTRTVLE